MKTIDITAVLAGAQLMVSMVETRRAARNGDGIGADASQELEQIERQLGKLESIDGPAVLDVRSDVVVTPRTARKNAADAKQKATQTK